MCGISGIVGEMCGDRRDAMVRAMTSALAHRGPDGEGFFRGRDASLGHRRLAIIDPSTGQQPLSNEDGTIWLTFNGEIYNYRELRQELLARGHRFKTNGDSEVIVHAYEEWGADCVVRFRGMFAFGLVDLTRQRLLIARDQLGIKPLYYSVSRGRVAFASELPSLLEAQQQPPRVCRQAIEFFLRYRYVPAPSTCYEEIWKLPPATYQVYDFRGNLEQETEYWQLRFRTHDGLSQDEWLEAFEETLNDSVRTHLVADVPFGAFLSGGVDSTLVLAAMRRILSGPITAYSIAFEEEAYSELSFAQQAASALGIELRHEVVRPDILNSLSTVFSQHGEPFADTSAIPTSWLAERARRDVPMVLSGDGADEAFAGYARYGRWLQDSFLSDAKQFLKYPKRLTRRIAECLQRRLAADRVGRWENQFVGVIDRATRRRLWRTENRHLLDVRNPAFARAGARARGLDRLSFAQYVDIHTYLPGDILAKVDIASMRHGLEVRTPFTDVRVMELAASLPRAERTCRLGQQDVMKVLPKRCLEKQFSPEFVHRKKMGFAIPEADWIARGTKVRACFDDLVASTDAPIFDYLQPDGLQEITREFDERGMHATSLWSVFSLAFWLNQHASHVPLQKVA